MTAAQSGDNQAATLKANLIERKWTQLLEVLDIFRPKKVTCITTRCQRWRAADFSLYLTHVFMGDNKGSWGSKGVRSVPSLYSSSLEESGSGWGVIVCLHRRGKGKLRGCEHFLTFSPNWLSGEESHLPQKSRDMFQKHGLMSWMLDCHVRAEGAAAGLVLPNHGWGCLTAQKPTQHWLPANYRLKEVAACLFLGCRGIHLHFSESSWATKWEFRQ